MRVNQAIEDFKQQVIPRIPLFYYELGTKEFLVKQDGGSNQREWVSFTESQMSKVLVTSGIRGAKNKNEDMSPVSRVLCDATMNSERTVHYSGPIAGYREGLVSMGGTRLLITASPRIIKPAAGDCSNIRAVCDGLLGELNGVQLPFFYAWLKLSYIALRSGNTRGMPALAICGPKDCGKTFIQQHLITPILGGRMARPHAFMTGKTNFNADLFAAEHLAMGDENPSTDLRARRQFGAYLKSFVAEEDQQLHAKFCDARTVRPFWRVTISLNDEPENVLTLPPMDDSISDKLILLGARTFTWPMRLVQQSEKEAFAKQFASEIPAFLQWLIDMPISETILAQRYTIRAFHNPRILNHLIEVSPEYRLAELIKMCFFSPPHIDSKLTVKAAIGKVSMTALEMERRLTADDSPVYYEARQLLGGGGRKLSTYLGRLSQRFPQCVFQERTRNSRNWVLSGIDTVLASVGLEYDGVEKEGGR